MSTDLAVRSDSPDALAAIRAAVGSNNALANSSDSMFDEMAKGADYLCRLQLQGIKSTMVADGKIERGHYAYIISKEKYIDLGLSVDILPITWRPRAIDMSGDTPVSFFDPASAEFKDVSDRSFLQDSNCTFGPDFLVWIPEAKHFASLHFGSKTARIDAPALKQLMDQTKAATLTYRTIKKPKYTWDAMTVNPCSTPFDLPPVDKMTVQIQKFVDEQNRKGPVKADVPPAETQRPR